MTNQKRAKVGGEEATTTGFDPHSGGIDASLRLIKIGDIVETKIGDVFTDLGPIKEDETREIALILVQNGKGRYRIVRRGVDARVVLTY
jgi:hypothetical protein